ncbi:MAG: hypothetical protein ACKVQQ_20965 [Burkholderiales bacterium]
MQIELGKAILARQGTKAYSTTLEDQPFQTFKLQLQALGLIELRYTSTTKGGMALFWSLTARGNQSMLQLRVVRKDDHVRQSQDGEHPTGNLEGDSPCPRNLKS